MKTSRALLPGLLRLQRRSTKLRVRPNPHTHDFEQVAYILSGTLDYFVANEKGEMVAHRMVAGSTLAIPAGARHYAQNVGVEPVLNLDIYPVRRPELLPRTKSSARAT
jgi:quercetin dioxygenase-like cupin family protein